MGVFFQWINWLVPGLKAKRVPIGFPLFNDFVQTPLIVNESSFMSND